MSTRSWLLIVLVACAFSVQAYAADRLDTRTLVILYTNDIHDHVLPGPGGVGGLAWIGGYVEQLRRFRDDVVLLDAGDAAEKGDLVAFLSKSELTFELMGLMDYDAIAIGNHEHNLGLNQLRRFDALTGFRLLSLNLIANDGLPIFAPSRLIERNGVRVAVSGMALPRRRDTLDFEQSGQALARHVKALSEQANPNLIVVVCHVGIDAAKEWASMAPEVNRGAELGLFHVMHIIRNPLLPGSLTRNDLFRAAADRGHELVHAQIKGGEIQRYLQWLTDADLESWGLTQWAGFAASPDGDGRIQTDLELQRSYHVVMPQREWENRFLRFKQGAPERNTLTDRVYSATPADFSAVDALASFLSGLPHTVEAELDRLRALQGNGDPREPALEAEFLRRTIGLSSAQLEEQM